VRNAPEKLFVTEFKDLMPPTLITSDRTEIASFRAEHQDIILKPLYGNGGAGVFRLKPGDENLNALLEMFTQFYRELRSVSAFAGASLNIEGAVCHRDKIRLFQRGNGLASGKPPPVNAIVDLELETFLAWLDGDGPVPPLLSTTTFDLGVAQGVAFGFTDGAVLADGRLAFLACAEATSDVTSDGPVVGVRFGLIDDSGSVRAADVVDADGRPTRYKLEGVESRLYEPGVLDVVADLDAPDEPGLLAELVYNDS